MADLLISKTGTKNAAKGVNVSGDFYPGLDKAVRGLIADAVKRAKSNGRKTVRSTDI